MLKPINSIIKDSIGNINSRINIVTGIVATDNGDGSYDVFISESDRAYPKIFTLSRNPDLAVGDKVRILYKNGCKELPIILPPVKPSALILFESQPNSSSIYPYINSSIQRLGQHFTVLSNHSVEKIALKLGKYNSTATGTAYLYLYKADVNGYPTGAILATAEIDISLLVFWDYGANQVDWITVTLNTPVDLVSDDEMVLVINSPTANSNKIIFWGQSVDGDNKITTGKGIWSSNSGASWEKRRVMLLGGISYWADFTFKIYGKAN